MNEKLLTLIVPSYNMEKYLERCCRSVLIGDAELRSRLEVLIVNDGSKDRTSAIAHEIGRSVAQSGRPACQEDCDGYSITDYGVVRVVDKPNGHYGSCVNVGLKVAKGTFVKLLDADDSFEPEGFFALMKFLSEKEGEFEARQVDLIITDHYDVDEGEKVIGTIRYKGPKGFHTVEDFIASRAPMHPSMSTYRTGALRQIGYRQTEGIMYTDLEWSAYPMEGIRNCWYLPVVMYRYLRGREGQSITPEIAARNVRMVLQILERFADELGSRTITGKRREFMLRKLRSFADVIIWTSVFAAPYDQIDGILVRMFACLEKRYPEIVRQLEKARVVKRHPYYYLRAWRKRSHLSRLTIWGLRLYSKVANRRAKT